MKKSHYLIVLIIFLLAYSTLRFGEFNTGNGQEVLALNRMQDLSYLSNDWFVNSMEEFNARTYYLQSVSFIDNQINDLELTYFLLYILIYSLIFINFFYLADLFFKNSKKSFFITVLSFIAITFSLDGTDLTKLTLIPASIGWLFCLFSINLYFRKKYFLAFLAAGISSIFQVVIGSINFAILVGDIILRKPLINKQKIINLLKTIPFLIVYSATVIPLMLINAKTSTPKLAEYSSKIVSWFHSGHILPSSWGFTKWIIFFLFIIFFYLAIKKSICNQEYKKSIRNFAIVVALICFVGWFFVEIIPLSSIVKMQLFRATLILNFFGIIFIGDYIYNRIKNTTNPLEKIFFLILPLSLLSIPSLLVLVSAFFIIEFLKKIFNLDIFKTLWKDKTILSLIILVFLTIALIISKNFSINLINFLPNTSHSTITYLIAPITFYPLALLYLNTKIIKKIIPLIIILFTISLFIFYPPLEREYTYGEERWEMINFVRTTPEDSLFLTPPHFEAFRSFEGRAIVVDEQHPYTDEGVVQWFERVKDLSNNYIQEPKTSDPFKLNEYYHTLNQSDIIKLKEKYHFDYAIFNLGKELPFQKVFQNKDNIIYKIAST